MKRFFIVGLVLLMFCLAVSFTSIPLEAMNYGEVDSKALADMLGRGVPLIDIRTEAEWLNTGVIEGSRLMTAFDQSGRIVPGFFERLRKVVGREDKVVLICHSGGRTSFLARALAEQLQYSYVFHALGGIARWISDGHPLIPPGQ